MRVLDVDNVAPVLLEWGLITGEDIVRGDLQLVDAARRNRNLKIIRRSRPSYLLKQPIEEEAVHTLACEASFYGFCAAEPRAAAMLPLLPRLARYQKDPPLVVLDLLTGVAPYWEHPQVDSPERLEAIGDALGRALGVFHRTFRASGPLADHPQLGWLGDSAPWILWVHKPGPEILARLSAANLKTLQILQGKGELRRHLDAIRREWRVDTVIHGDLKADNILVRPTDPPRAPEVFLVDWELVQRGDAGWDLAGVFHEHFVHWVRSMPIGAELTPAQMAAQATFPLRTTRGILRALWRAYCGAAELAGPDTRATLLRSVRYTAARLIQTAYEIGAYAPTLPNMAILLLQLSDNIFRRPEAACLDLFGIDPGAA